MTFGAPAGALTSKFGGIFAFRASSSLYSGRFGSWIGSTVRSVGAVTGEAACWATTGAGRASMNNKARLSAVLNTVRSIMFFSLD